MKVKDIMTRDVISISPDASLRDAGKIFREKRISGVPVINAGKELVGIVTTTDLLRMLHAIYRWSKWERNDSELNISRIFEEEKTTATVGSSMTKLVYTVEEEMDVNEVLYLMFEHDIHTIPVTRDKKLVGIVGVRDIIGLYYTSHTGGNGRE